MMDAVDWKKSIWPYLTEQIKKLLDAVDNRLPVEELRLRCGGPVQVLYTGGERILRREGGGGTVTRTDCAEILQNICGHSLYACEKELMRGFMTLPGGCRVGISGSMSAAGGGFLSGDATGFNFRIARAVNGAADAALSYLVEHGVLSSALIVSPPGYGKTTVLRDIARQASMGQNGIHACRVCVVDTRYELAGSVNGIEQMGLGPRTDVLSGISKEEGMRMMITNMAPDLLITDELSTAEEAAAALEAQCCGVTLIASAHAASPEALLARPAMRLLMNAKVFERYLLLSHVHGVISAAFDADLNRIYAGEHACCVS